MTGLQTVPFLSCEDSLCFEGKLFSGDEEAEWEAMTSAGQGLADELSRDLREWRNLPRTLRILVLVGKGHNGGDALIATQRLLKFLPMGQAFVLPLVPVSEIKPNVRRAWQDLEDFGRVLFLDPLGPASDSAAITVQLEEAGGAEGFDVCLDGLVGMQFQPPLRQPLRALLEAVNSFDGIGVRVAVDMPSGVGDDSGEISFRADFTYATGIAKTPLLEECNAENMGRLRFVDLGFFNRGAVSPTPRSEELLLSKNIGLLRTLRPARCDKRTFGRMVLIGGSRNMPGALLMAAKAAARSGAGLLTVCCPESVVSSFAVALPEAIWIALPETETGGLALEGRGQALAALEGASVLVAGPGLGSERETMVLLEDILQEFHGPVLLDADALRPDAVNALACPDRAILTPHAGELVRLAEGEAPLDANALKSFCGERGGVTMIVKSSLSRVCDPHRVLVNYRGGPVLARGGSGDLLAGITGALLGKGRVPLEAAALGALWHGVAADCLARQRGQEAVVTTELLDYLAFALRNDV
jgi:ADP-dependent NAD(P)H-hydrate dehydratase / NAD(P)H-hydrate epimerase